MSAAPRISHHAAESWTIRHDFEEAQIFVRHGKHIASAGYPHGTTWVSVAILSSFGCWAYHWNHCGDDDWRDFLASLEEDYAMRKLMGAEWKVFSATETLREARRSVLERRRRGALDADDAREAWEEIAFLIDFGERDENEIIRALSAVDAFRDSYWDLSMHEPAANGVAFWRIIWRPWVAHLVAEKVAT